MKPQSLEQTLTKKLEAAKAATEAKLFRKWKIAKDVEEREDLSAQIAELSAKQKEIAHKFIDAGSHILRKLTLHQSWGGTCCFHTQG